MARVKYKVQGTAAQDPGQVWTVEGEREGTIPTLFDVVMVEAFQKLTRGEARYLHLQTCRGPYQITRIELEQVNPG